MANADTPGRQPIPPEKRRRLQAQFEAGSKVAAKGEYDYATEMFTTCVVGDPGNLLYVSNFLGNLQKKYTNNKKGANLASMRSAGSKAYVKKASAQKDWTAVIKSGLEVLKLNPWDTGTLTAMAAACEHLEFDECQLAYLKAALEANMADADINRLAGRALARQGKFDDAIRCWVRVLKAVPKDPEAARAVADLTVEKTIQHGRYETAESTQESRVDAQSDSAPGAPQISHERQFEKAIAKDPADVSNYLQLAQLHMAKERFDEAEKIFQKALEVSGGDANIGERLEDLQLRRMREQLAIAEKLARNEKTQQAEDRYKAMRVELNRAELDVFRKRSDRNPAHFGYKIELALRLQRAGLFKEAIPLFQQAQADPARRGEVLLALGECFQQIKQFKLAMSNYDAAVSEIPVADGERKKLTLYRAGVLAMGLKDLDKADRYLSELAGLQFSYKDVAARLDKINEMRDKG